MSVGRTAPRHFHDKGKWITFIEQPQLTLRLVDRRRIHKDAALDQVAMHIRYHAADITLRIGSAVILIFPLAGIDVRLYSFLILKEVTMIHRVDLAGRRAFDLWMTEGEFSDGRIQGEAIHAPAGSIDHHGGRPIDDIAGRDLAPARLQKIFLGTGLT